MSKLIVAQVRDLLNQVMNEKITFSRFVEILNETNSIESLIDRNYAAQIKRGQITMKTDLSDFLDKIVEEVKEFKNSYTNDGYYEDIDDKELIDIMLVCFSMAKHFGIDWQQVMTEKVEYNEKRED